MTSIDSVEHFMQHVLLRDPHQPEFAQAVREVMTTLWPFLQQHPHYRQAALLERLIEPERVIQFRVSWVDDRNQVQVNRAWRVQFNSAIGPYKGGMRFHPSVNLSILKFLGFEQTLKNALTTLPMGGGKGGSDFNPKGKSDGEIMRFCQALIGELYRHLGPDTDVPAGDIGVGSREVGYMAGMMKKLANHTACVFTGKGLAFGGSLMRPQATGYGLVYFTDAMLQRHGLGMEGMRVAVSGSGNVAQYAIEKAMALGASVITASDSNGSVVDEAGFTAEKLAQLCAIKASPDGRIADYARTLGLTYLEGQQPWHVPVDIALPCATQNELDSEAARMLIANGYVPWPKAPTCRPPSKRRISSCRPACCSPPARQPMPAALPPRGWRWRRMPHACHGRPMKSTSDCIRSCWTFTRPASTTAVSRRARPTTFVVPTSPVSSRLPTQC